MGQDRFYKVPESQATYNGLNIGGAFFPYRKGVLKLPGDGTQYLLVPPGFEECPKPEGFEDPDEPEALNPVPESSGSGGGDRGEPAAHPEE